MQKTNLFPKQLFHGFVIASISLLIACGGSSSNDSIEGEVDPPQDDPIENTTNKNKIKMKVMSYNVHNCVGMDEKFDIERVAKVISKSGVEAVALQELDSMTQRYPGHDILKELADHTGMHNTFGASIDFRGGKYGVGILTKEKPISHYRIDLPCSSEPRTLLLVELKDYYFCCTHLSLHAEDRHATVKIIMEEAKKLNKPIILGGDFNAKRSETSMLTLSKSFDILRKSPYNTFPADAPRSEIDYICVYKGDGATVEELKHTTLEEGVASDHRPIVAEFTLLDPIE